MIGILIIAHGKLGDSLIDCASHVLGKKPPMLSHLVVDKQDDPAILIAKARQMIAELNDGDGVLVLSDMYGATPCNVVTKLIKPNVVEGVAGVNLPMLVRTLTYRDVALKSLVEKALSGGREGVVHFTDKGCDWQSDKELGNNEAKLESNHSESKT